MRAPFASTYRFAMVSPPVEKHRTTLGACLAGTSPSFSRHADPSHLGRTGRLGLIMTDTTLTGAIGSARSPKPKLDQPINPLTLILFFGVLAAGFLFVAYSLYVDVD